MGKGIPISRADVCMFLATDKIYYDARVQREARALSERGLRVAIVTLTAPNVEQLDEIAGARLFKLHLWSKSLPKRPIFWAVKYLEFLMRAFIVGFKVRPRWFHCHDLPALPLGVVLSRLTRARVIYDSHEIWLGLPMSHILRVLWAWIERTLISRVNVVVTTDEFRAEWLKKRYSLETVGVVMNIPEATPGSTHELGSRRNVRNDIGVSNDDRIGVYFGDMHDGRYLEEIIRSIDYVPDNVHLALVGPCGEDYKEKLENVRATCQHADRVHLIGAIPPRELIGYISGADFSLVLFQKVPLNNLLCSPNKLFESLRAGLPLLVTDNPLLRKLVEGEQVGFVMTSEPTPESIGSSIKLLLDGDMEQFRLNCRRAAARYTWEVEKNRLLAMYGVN